MCDGRALWARGEKVNEFGEGHPGEFEQFAAGDEVIVKMPGVVTRCEGSGIAVRGRGGLVFNSRSLERNEAWLQATCPPGPAAHDSAGTVREGGFVKVGPRGPGESGAWFRMSDTLTEEVLDGEMGHRPVIGYMPGSPAARQAGAQQPGAA